MAIGGIFLEALEADCFERFGNLIIEPGRRNGRMAYHLKDCFHGRIAAKGRAAGQKFVETAPRP